MSASTIMALALGTALLCIVIVGVAWLYVRLRYRVPEQRSPQDLQRLSELLDRGRR